MKDIGSLHKVINKASSIVSHIKKSIHASEFLEDFKRVQASNVTRWNSEVKMIRSVLNIPADKLDQLDTQKLTHHDRSLLTDLLEILSPFEAGSNRCNTKTEHNISQLHCTMYSWIKISSK